MTIPQILEDDWFKKDYKAARFAVEEDVNLDDVDAVFNDSKVAVLCWYIFFFSLDRDY